ncbi:MAG: DNA-directed RNA polymerase subunit D [Archaeoglobaceae archaeon]|nr:DNA-directed RNA polymerase subunit D [Archaeoglobaceae archaeon]MDW8118498.1 DNA-directed RNA polymerase subunit D [Archaeoglobaceae archaeon]
MPKIEIVSEKENKIIFKLLDASPALANSIRRTMKSLVPVLAIDYVDFYTNSSNYYDEMIAHRLSMLPIKTDLNRFNMREQCSCEGVGCPNCQISFRLNVEGPKVVYAKDFISDDPNVHFAFEDIPVIELFNGQQLMIEAVARLGIGKEHSKFQPVSACFYRVIPKIEISDKCDLCKNCISACPRKVFEEKDGKIIAKKLKECSMCMECVKICEQKAIKVLETNDFFFVAEGTGAIPIKEVLSRAIMILKNKAENFNKLLSEIDV